MKKHDIAILALRLMAVYLVILFFSVIPMLTVFFRAMDGQIWLVPFIQIIAFLGMAGLLYGFAPTISRQFLGSSPDEPVDFSGEISFDFQRFAFQLTGIIICSRAIPDLTQAFIQAFRSGMGDYPSTTLLQRMAANWVVLVGPFGRSLIGIYLVFGSDNIARFLINLRPTRREKYNRAIHDDEQNP